MIQLQIFRVSPIDLNLQIKLFAMYHPSNLGMNNRLKIEKDKTTGRMDLMRSDWKKINLYLKTNRT